MSEAGDDDLENFGTHVSFEKRRLMVHSWCVCEQSQCNDFEADFQLCVLLDFEIR